MNYLEQSRDCQFEPLNHSAPTQARPGSTWKLQVMAERYRCGQPLHHPSDATLVALPVRKTMSATMSAFLRGLPKRERVVLEGRCDLQTTD